MGYGVVGILFDNHRERMNRPNETLNRSESRYAPGRAWRIAWRIAMMMFKNTFQSNIFSLTSLEVIV